MCDCTNDQDNRCADCGTEINPGFDGLCEGCAAVELARDLAHMPYTAGWFTSVIAGQDVSVSTYHDGPHTVVHVRQADGYPHVYVTFDKRRGESLLVAHVHPNRSEVAEVRTLGEVFDALGLPRPADMVGV